MDLKASLLKEAARLEAKAAQIREAAKVLGGGSKAEPGRRNRRKRLTCAYCGTRFLGITPRKLSNGPFCSNAHRAAANRARKEQALAIAAKQGRKPVTLIPGDGVSKGA